MPSVQAVPNTSDVPPSTPIHPYVPEQPLEAQFAFLPQRVSPQTSEQSTAQQMATNKPHVAQTGQTVTPPTQINPTLTNQHDATSVKQGQTNEPSDKQVATKAFQAFFNTLTPEQQFAIISQVHQSAYPTHSIPTIPGNGRLQPSAPMRPTDVRKDWS
jgi:hypothetical protein